MSLLGFPSLLILYCDERLMLQYLIFHTLFRPNFISVHFTIWWVHTAMNQKRFIHVMTVHAFLLLDRIYLLLIYELHDWCYIRNLVYVLNRGPSIFVFFFCTEFRVLGWVAATKYGCVKMTLMREWWHFYYWWFTGRMRFNRRNVYLTSFYHLGQLWRTSIHVNKGFNHGCC